MKVVVVYLLAAGLIGAGCTAPKPPPPTAEPSSYEPLPINIQGGTNNPHQNLIVTPATNPTGKVMRVNENARFAVLNFPIGAVPAAGQRLDVYRKGLKVGEVKVTGPQQDDNTVADILTGDAQVGDELRAK